MDTDGHQTHEKKVHSTSLIIKEMQIKLQWGHRLICSEWPLSKNPQTINAAEGMAKGNPPTLLVAV